ncbi:MAG: hypothetical protein JSS79_06680 [Bacteroidetes bacterium]|nr:hypothetical protein [Bacteroidota bacterium]
MKRILLIGLSFFFVALLSVLDSCIRQENDLGSQNCSSHCTTVSGKFLTDGGNSALANLNLTLSCFIGPSGSPGGTLREKATARTDASGNFNFTFAIKEDELQAYYQITMSIDKTKYYLCSSNADNTKIGLPPLKRDTTVYDQYIIPAKAFLDLTITNPGAIASSNGDYLGSTFISKFGNSVCGPAISWSELPGNPIEIQANQPVFMETVKVKAGNRIVTYDTLNLAPGQHKAITITF